MACSISLYYPREDTGSLFSLFLSIQAPSLPNALCKVGGMFLYGAPGIFFFVCFCRQRDTDLSSQRALICSLGMCPSLLSLDYGSNLE